MHSPLHEYTTSIIAFSVTQGCHLLFKLYLRRTYPSSDHESHHQYVSACRPSCLKLVTPTGLDMLALDVYVILCQHNSLVSHLPLSTNVTAHRNRAQSSYLPGRVEDCEYRH